MSKTIFVNGRFLPAATPAILASDRGFTLGDGLFETMRASGGRIWYLPLHMGRLARGAAVLKIPVNVESLARAIVRTLAANDLMQAEATVRVTLSRGRSTRGLTLPEKPKPTLVISVDNFAPYPDALYQTGMSAVVLPQRRNEFALTASLKSLNYLEGVLGKDQAAAAGAHEGIFLNTQGFLAEACTANLFFVKDKVLHTPAVNCGLVPGVMRHTALKMARAGEIPVVEGKYKASTLFAGDEAFLTNVLMGVMPLTRVDGQPIGGGQPGPLTMRLLSKLKR